MLPHYRTAECAAQLAGLKDDILSAASSASEISGLLDAIGPKLCEAGVGFHAHSGTGRVGSIWSAGAGALAVELRGEFDYRFFNESRLDLLDYCAKDSSGRCDPDRC